LRCLQQIRGTGRFLCFECGFSWLNFISVIKFFAGAAVINYFFFAASYYFDRGKMKRFKVSVIN